MIENIVSLSILHKNYLQTSWNIFSNELVEKTHSLIKMLLSNIVFDIISGNSIMINEIINNTILKKDILIIVRMSDTSKFS